MPELPEVETTVRGLAAVLAGDRLVRVAVHRPDLRRPFPVDLVQAMTGARIDTLGRRAKYGLLHTDRAQTMVFHLGCRAGGASIRAKSANTIIWCSKRPGAMCWR